METITAVSVQRPKLQCKCLIFFNSTKTWKSGFVWPIIQRYNLSRTASKYSNSGWYSWMYCCYVAFVLVYSAFLFYFFCLLYLNLSSSMPALSKFSSRLPQDRNLVDKRSSTIPECALASGGKNNLTTTYTDSPSLQAFTSSFQVSDDLQNRPGFCLTLFIRLHVTMGPTSCVYAAINIEWLQRYRK